MMIKIAKLCFAAIGINIEFVCYEFYDTFKLMGACNVNIIRLTQYTDWNSAELFLNFFVDFFAMAKIGHDILCLHRVQRFCTKKKCILFAIAFWMKHFVKFMT